MSEHSHENDRNQAGLSSSEYRTKLLTKLNCLMAVLEVAITKITRSMELPSANQERLTKIRANLQNTLSICTRAKETLEKSMNGGERARPAIDKKTERVRPANPSGSMSYRDYVELSSIEEYQKFKNLPPIAADELESANIDELLKKLYDA